MMPGISKETLGAEYANCQADSAGSVDPGLRAANRCKTWSSCESEEWEYAWLRKIDERMLACKVLGPLPSSLSTPSVMRRIRQADSYHGPEEARSQVSLTRWEACRIYDGRTASGLMENT